MKGCLILLSTLLAHTRPTATDGGVATRSPDLASSLAALLDEDKIVNGRGDQKRYELEKNSTKSSLYIGCMYIHVFLSTPFSCSGCGVGTNYSGRRLADALMQCSSSRLPPSVHREGGEVGGDGDGGGGGVDVVEQLARSALSLLLASRHSAKQAALDGGTHKHTHTHIHMCTCMCVHRFS